MVFEGATFDVDLAVTPGQRATGLMGREHMGDREGMLFIYDVEGVPRFWMRGMVIPLDMVWIDADGVVAGVTANVSPAPEGTIPEVYSPASTDTICSRDQLRSGGVGGNSCRESGQTCAGVRR